MKRWDLVLKSVMSRTTIEDLPPGVIERIFRYLLPDLKNCMQVNKTWYRYSKELIEKAKTEFYDGVCNMSVEWTSIQPESSLEIPRRYIHSVCVHDDAMYVFGGASESNETHNDLFRLDLLTHCWTELKTNGTKPPPKAWTSLVSYEGSLIVFGGCEGGWDINVPYPLDEDWEIFNHVHRYDIATNCWSVIETEPNCPPMAAHTATVHGDLMVVYGGIQKKENGDLTGSSDIWALNLKTFEWRKPTISTYRPVGRFGHSQIYIDNRHLMILGGCIQPRLIMQDVWVLRMFDNPSRKWLWRKLLVGGEDKSFPCRMLFHPACKVKDQVVMLNRSRNWIIPPPSVIDAMRSEMAEYKTDCSSNDSDIAERLFGPTDCLEIEHNMPSTSGVKDNLSDRETFPASDDSNDCGAFVTLFPSNSKDKNTKKRSLSPESISSAKRTPDECSSQQCIGEGPSTKELLLRSTYNRMCIYVLDISEAMSEKGYVFWRELKKQSYYVPTERTLYSLVAGHSELIMFGGIKPKKYTNEVILEKEILNTLYSIRAT